MFSDEASSEGELSLTFLLFVIFTQVHKGVKGFVKDSQGSPIPGAAIHVDNRRKEVITAKDGDYWRLLLPGGYKVTATARGYEPQTKEITVTDRDAAELNFVLKKSTGENSNMDEEQQDSEKPNPVEDSKPEAGSPVPAVDLNSAAAGEMTQVGSMMPSGGDYGVVMNGGGMESTIQNGQYGISNSMGSPMDNMGGDMGLGSNVDMGGPINDAELDRFAMMSPYEAESKDNTKGFVHVTTDEHEPAMQHANYANAESNDQVGMSDSNSNILKKSVLGRPRQK